MGEAIITKPEVLEVVKYAHIAMGIYMTNDEHDGRLLINYTFDALKGIGTTYAEAMKALELYQNGVNELPRNLSANFFKNTVLSMRSKNKDKIQEHEATRETTEEERKEGVELYYTNYKIGGATWQLWYAGSAWIARYLQLDIEPFRVRAAAKIKQDTVEDGIAKGLRTFVANIEPSKVENEAERMAVQAYFRNRYDKEQCKD